MKVFHVSSFLPGPAEPPRVAVKIYSKEEYYKIVIESHQTLSLVHEILNLTFYKIESILYNSFLRERNIAMEKTPTAALGIFAVSLAALLFSCGKSPFSTSTDVGRDIVNDGYRDVVNVSNTVKLFTGSAAICTSYSMRDAGDSVLPWSFRGFPELAAGTFEGLDSTRDTAYSYIEFRPGLLRQSSYENDRNNLKAAYSIDSVVFLFYRLRMNIGAEPTGKRP